MKKDISLSSIHNFKITSADTDIIGRLKPSAMLNFIIQAAVNSATQLGFGFNEMKNNSLFWVLSRIDIEINRPLLWNEDISVETWPKNIDKIMYLRDFIIRDSENKIAAKSASGWLAVDTECKRPRKIVAVDQEIFYLLKNKHALEKIPQKLLPIKSGEKYDVKSHFSDLDLNGHVTATRYLDKMTDTLETQFLIDNYPKKISINYIRETMPDDNLEITKNTISENEYIFEGKNKTAQTIAFRGIIKY